MKNKDSRSVYGPKIQPNTPKKSKQNLKPVLALVIKVKQKTKKEGK